MSVVLDASLTMTWYFDDEITTETEAVLDHVTEAGAVVPTLWKLEVVSAFQSALRRQRISPDYRDKALTELTELSITIDPDTGVYAWTRTLRLAERLGLTIYDATYLELAQRRGLPLATLDRQLRDAATTVGVSLFGLRTL